MAANGILNFQGTNKATFVGASSNIVLDTVTSSLGVGVDVNGPTSNLHVVGNAYVSTDVTIAGNIDFQTITQNGVAFSGGGGGGTSPWLQTTIGTPADGIYYTAGNVAVDTNTFFVDTTNNRVGIGTTTPGSALDVSGTVTATAFAGNATSATQWVTARTITVTGGVTGTTSSFDGSGDATLVTTLTDLDAAKITAGTLPVTRGGTGTTTSTGSGSVVLSAAPSFTGDVTFDTNTLFVNSATSNVGIGTVTPTRTLDVTGDINFTGDLTQGGNPFGGGAFLTDGTKAYYTDGPVGIANVSALTTQTLQIGANVSVDDVSSDKLVVNGNVYVSRALRAIDLVESYEVRANFFTVKNIDIRAERPRQGGVIL